MYNSKDMHVVRSFQNVPCAVGGANVGGICTSWHVSSPGTYLELGELVKIVLWDAIQNSRCEPRQLHIRRQICDSALRSNSGQR